MNLKNLTEKRADLQLELEALVTTAKAETRAMTDEEAAKFDNLEKEIKSMDSTISMEERAIALKTKKPKSPEEMGVEERAQSDIKDFANFIRYSGKLPEEKRTDPQNFTMANNGALLPTTIAKKIIETVKEVCPIYAKSELYHVKGTLKIPVYGLADTDHDIAVGYQEEFTDITADAGKFTSVDLTGYLAGALSLIGKSVINSSDIDLTNIVIRLMAQKIAIFLSKECLNGTSTKATGALSTTNTLLAGSISAISADNLIDLQCKVPTVYQKNACWTMATATFTALKKLKDGNGQYLLQSNFSQDFPYTILGKPVYLDDNMPAIGSANRAVLYGDYSGLSVNMREDVEIQVLTEKYATQHAIGVVSWFEFDSKVSDHQKLAALVMSVS